MNPVFDLAYSSCMSSTLCRQRGAGGAPARRRRRQGWARVRRCCCRPRETRDEGRVILRHTVTLAAWETLGGAHAQLGILLVKKIWRWRQGWSGWLQQGSLPWGGQMKREGT